MSKSKSQFELGARNEGRPPRLEPAPVQDDEPTPVPKETPSKIPGVGCVVFIYDGTACDTHTTPAVNRRGDDGKPVQREYVRPETVERIKLDTYRLWGIEFPENEPVEVGPGDRRLTGKGLSLENLVAKASGLGCFTIQRDTALMG